MGLDGPKHLEQVKQIKLSRLLPESQNFFESGNHHKKNRMPKTLQASYQFNEKK
jgi:hypothetical protein